MDSDTLSKIAIMISIGVPIFEYLYNRKINDINLEAHYFDAVYEKFLLEEIPQQRLKIERAENGRVCGIDEFIITLRNMRKKSLYFKFVDEPFYKEICSLIQKLEDELVLLENIVGIDEYNRFQGKIDSEIYEIYETITCASRKKGLF